MPMPAKPSPERLAYLGWLLEHGASPSVLDADGYTFIHQQPPGRRKGQTRPRGSA